MRIWNFITGLLPASFAPYFFLLRLGAILLAAGMCFGAGWHTKAAFVEAAHAHELEAAIAAGQKKAEAAQAISAGLEAQLAAERMNSTKLSQRLKNEIRKNLS